MNPDFDKMASEAKLAHDVRMALKSRQAADRKRERSRYVEGALAALSLDVLPLLEQAIVAFSKHGIATKLTREFDLKEHVGKDPAITFKCAAKVDGPPFEEPVAYFSSDGTVITVIVPKTEEGRSAEKLGSAPRGRSEALVAAGIERALNGLFAAIEHKQGPEAVTFKENPATTPVKSGDDAGLDSVRRLRSSGMR